MWLAEATGFLGQSDRNYLVVWKTIFPKLFKWNEINCFTKPRTYYTVAHLEVSQVFYRASTVSRKKCILVVATALQNPAGCNFFYDEAQKVFGGLILTTGPWLHAAD